MSKAANLAKFGQKLVPTGDPVDSTADQTIAGKKAFSALAYATKKTLTDGATVNWDASTGQVVTLTLGGNRTMAAPTNLQDGAFYNIEIIQSAGNNTLAWNSVFKFTAGVAPVLSTAAGARDYITFRSNGTNLYEQGRSLGAA
jgi:hypothetical protein